VDVNYAEPYPPSPKDRVIVKITHKPGVRWQGRLYREGDTLELTRAIAEQRMAEGHATIITVAHYAKGPAPPPEPTGVPPADWDADEAETPAETT
jgi:hypothetical protein